MIGARQLLLETPGKPNADHIDQRQKPSKTHPSQVGRALNFLNCRSASLFSRSLTCLWSFRYQGRHLAGENRDVPCGALQNPDAATEAETINTDLRRHPRRPRHRRRLKFKSRRPDQFFVSQDLKVRKVCTAALWCNLGKIRKIRAETIAWELRVTIGNAERQSGPPAYQVGGRRYGSSQGPVSPGNYFRFADYEQPWTGVFSATEHARVLRTTVKRRRLLERPARREVPKPNRRYM